MKIWLSSCDSQSDEEINPQAPHFTTDAEGEKNIHFQVDISKVDKDNLSEYVDSVADQLESDYGDFFNGSTIDRKQLYGEILFHMKNDWWYSGSNPADINVYADGSVRDPRDVVNYFSGKNSKGYKSDEDK